MSVVGEGVGTGEITTANFGEIFLLAYAANMRQHAADQSRAARLVSYARTLGEQALETQQNILLPEEGLPPTEVLDQLIDPVADAMALVELASLVRNRRRPTDLIGTNYCRKNIIGKTATVTRIPERFVNRSSLGWKGRRQEATGTITDLYLGGTESHIQIDMDGLIGGTWTTGNLVDPQDFSSNVTIQFQAQESEA